jgi:hypothetical protein
MLLKLKLCSPLFQTICLMSYNSSSLPMPLILERVTHQHPINVAPHIHPYRQTSRELTSFVSLRQSFSDDNPSVYEVNNINQFSFCHTVNRKWSAISK